MARKRSRANDKSESAGAKKIKLCKAIHEFISKHDLIGENVPYEYCELTTSLEKQDSFLEIVELDVNFKDLNYQFQTCASIQQYLLATDTNWFLLLFAENKQELHEISFVGHLNSTQSNLTICKHFKKQKFFTLNGYIESTSKILKIKVFMHRGVIYNDYDKFIKEFNSKNDCIMSVMSFIFDYKYFDENLIQEFSDNLGISSFYCDMYNIQKELNFSDEPSICAESLIPTLWPYQERAVKWMKMREQYKIDYNIDYFVKHTFDGQEWYYHELLGYFVSKQVYDQYRMNHKIFPGGILADEMGLGKTVEMIALILSHKKRYVDNNFQTLVNNGNIFQFSKNPLQGSLQCNCGVDSFDIDEDLSLQELEQKCLSEKFHLKDDLIKCLFCGNYQHLECSFYQQDEDDFPYLCSRCWMHGPVDSASTLIVCPVSIIDQWISELKRHATEEIKVYRYCGVRNEYIAPPNLAKNDIVITTYDILRAEVDFLSSFQGNFRSFKRYFYSISPLVSVNWWRLCFDEGQLVEGTLTRTFKMANLLSAVNRWAVTGTPIQRGIQDLYGLFCFIGFEPYTNKFIWEHALNYPFCKGDSGPLISALSSCFWRTPKVEVENEIRLLKPIIIEKKLDFSQIERDFYLSESTICKRSIYNLLQRYPLDTKLTDLPSGIQTKVFAFALKLRQICCHPQVIQKMKVTQATNNSRINQMEFGSLQDVLDKMIDDSKYDCEKIHREKINAMNGLAALYVRLKNCKLAIDVYRAALSSIEKNQVDFRTDKTQIYHIYFNMAQIVEIFGCLQKSPDGDILVENKDEELVKELKNLTAPDIVEEDSLWRYKAQQVFKEYIANMKESCNSLDVSREQVTKKCDDLKKNSKLNFKWYIYALNQLVQHYNEEIDIIVVLGEMANFDLFATNHERSIATIEFKITDYLTSLTENRSKMLQLFEDFDIANFAENSMQCIDCHIRKNRNVSKCILCKAKAQFDEYEKLLFTVKIKKQILRRKMADSVIIGKDTTKETNWNDNEKMGWLRRIAQFFKTKVSKEVDDYQLMVEEIDKFFAHYEECKKEFKIYRKYWTVIFEFINQIDELRQAQQRYVHMDFSSDSDFETLEGGFKDDEEVAEDYLKTTYGRLKYLLNLKKNLKNKDNIESRVCSICWVDLVNYVVIQCGHMVCSECLTKIVPPRCPVCRRPFNNNDLTLVNLNAPARETKESVKVIKVLGSCSTKLVHIIRCVKEIIDANEKIIIFSSWAAMLNRMETALKNNGMPCFNVSGASDKHFNDKLKNFKFTASINVLLLPTNFACKGLNLPEASHVIFINSIINKADELQAIGRINRIGQTKQTYVHKFIIRDTIEELIENCSENVYHKNATSEYNNMTISDFYNLFSIYRAV